MPAAQEMLSLRLQPLSPPSSLPEALSRLNSPLIFCREGEGRGIYTSGRLLPASEQDGLPVAALAPPLPPECLGNAAFCRAFGLRYAYVAGSMAKGISAVELVQALAAEGMLAFFGAGGLPPGDVAVAVDRLQQLLPDSPWGVNLIHSPLEPELEAKTVALLLERGVRLVEAAAFLDLTLPLVRYRTAGIRRDESGRAVAPNRLIAKVSREELAARFLAPPPAKLLRVLVDEGQLTAAQAELASQIPMADAITAEADSGGHTDNRPLPTVFPTLLAARDRAVAEHGYERPVFIGAGGGIGTPSAVAAAFAMGADYIVTGSVNQACVEAGTSDTVRQMLAEVRQADVTMAPAADMFEMGGRVQVSKRGTLFPMRAARLHELYREYQRYEDIPAAEREKLERTVFQLPIEAVWQQVQNYFAEHDPTQLQRAAADPRHRLALLFRWYLGLSAVWAQQGTAERKADFQIWCGPAMGAFNEWARGSHLEAPSARKVADVALNLLFGAARLLRWQSLRLQGVEEACDQPLSSPPLRRSQLEEYLR